MIVELKETNNNELEAVIPVDRIVEVKFGITNLADKQFLVTDEMIKRIIYVDNE